jgi:hypothetical protein
MDVLLLCSLGREGKGHENPFYGKGTHELDQIIFHVAFQIAVWRLIWSGSCLSLPLLLLESKALRVCCSVQLLTVELCLAWQACTYLLRRRCWVDDAVLVMLG